MSALPPGDLTPGPQMMSVGFSLAGIAVADTRKRLAEALRRFDDAASGVRRMFDRSPGANAKFEAQLVAAEPDTLRMWLDRALVLEEAFAEAGGAFAALLARARAKVVLNKYGLMGYSKVSGFSRELRSKLIPAIREMRLRIICNIAERANKAGVHVLDTTGDFCGMFRAITLEETKGWQETAHILANLKAAKALNDSISAAHVDKTEEFSSAPDGQSVLH